ncbi:acyltransferase [Nostoc sp. 106C]|uniref:acyltransferase family protein n=1 Tax=Nostoc sp. 106C TaxID=1932667 RepID=UPI000A36627F|nr:acyltransferase [Nostoc sp. 106C]OUL17465.1 acyltransferase [Nostoc sp. 106C]OUL21370.1 acyltransferase [Nostoc sp. RF31YmG]
MKQTNHLDTLLALRGFACLMVVILHCNPPRNSIIYQNYDFSWIILSHGFVAVWIFFVLSGYLMGKAFYAERYTFDLPGVINFWRNRILRILPLYYFVILICILFVYPNLLKIENWGNLVRLCTFTYNSSLELKSDLAFNGVIWSLSTEVQFYILVPFIYSYFKNCLWKKKQVLLALLSIFTLTFFIRCIFWISIKHEITDKFTYMFKYWYAPLITNLDLFICGFLINAWIKNQPSTKSPSQLKCLIKQAFKLSKLSKKTLSIIFLFFLYLFTAYHLYYQELWNLPEHLGKGIRTTTTFFILQPLTALVVSFFILAFESETYNSFIKNEKLSFATILRNPLRIMEVFGNLSYGVYVWHWPILHNISPIFTSTIPIEAFYARLTAALILSIVLATITYYLVELPFGKRKIYQQPGN